MRDNPAFEQLMREMRSGTDEQLMADLKRFVESFGDHDDDCPGYDAVAVGPEAELSACTCGFARRFDLFDEVGRRLAKA